MMTVGNFVPLLPLFDFLSSCYSRLVIVQTSILCTLYFVDRLVTAKPQGLKALSRSSKSHILGGRDICLRVIRNDGEVATGSYTFSLSRTGFSLVEKGLFPSR